MMSSEEQLLKALRERMLRAVNDMPFSGAPPINIYNGAVPSSVSEALSSSGANSPGNQVKAAQAGISPEELEYLVDINKRDVYAEVGEDKEGNPIRKSIGWDKSVHRYTKKPQKQPKQQGLDSLFGEGF